jgi:carboxymethylenebutenolidase
LQSALERAGANHRLEWYPGAQHGFAFPLREGIYDKPSAERHWARLFSLFRRNLEQRQRAP